MRRRVSEYRRPVRRRMSFWIWTILGSCSLLGLILLVVHRSQNYYIEPQISHKISDTAENRGSWISLNQLISMSTLYARQLADQITLAKAYVVIAKENHNLQFAWELSENIRKGQLLLSMAASRETPITSEEAEPVIHDLSSLIFKAQASHYDIATTIMTMKSHIQALDGRTNAATVQSTVFGEMLARSMPMSHHCIITKLTTDWLMNPPLNQLATELSISPRLTDNSLYHFCVFSDNLLAVSVVVNSTISNADHPTQLVFHIVTSGPGYGAMQAWFLRTDFKGSTIHVQSFHEFGWLNASYSPVIKQILTYGSQDNGFHRADSEPISWFKSKPSSLLLGNLLFYIPEMYPQLEKVVFLDDDVVVQKDITSLFLLDLHGNVNGAVETCLEAFHRYYKYLNFSNPIISAKFDPQACAWAFGMNVFDLVQWKRGNLTARYHYWCEQNVDHLLWKRGTLPPGLLTFYGLTEALDRRWHVLGLGYDMNVDNRLIESAAVMHFNGNLKPWLPVGIGKYRLLWQQYVNQSHPYIRHCAGS